MANEPANDQPARLPLFYKSVVPLNSQLHAGLTLDDRVNHPFSAGVQAIPLTVDEFVMAQRFFPIVFGPGEHGAPQALLGLQEGENLFVDADGNWRNDVYVPAFVRRYPFVLARLSPEAQELSLCFDEESGYFTPGDAGNLIDNGQPTELTKSILQFCEQYEVAIQRTRNFMNELRENNLLADGEATIQVGDGPPAVFRGFGMIAEEKVRDMRGDKARKLLQSGAMALIFAHFFSLSHMRDLYARRMAQQQAA